MSPRLRPLVFAAVLQLCATGCTAPQTVATPAAPRAAGTPENPDTSGPPVQQPRHALAADHGPWIVNKRVLLVSLEQARGRIAQLEAWLRTNRGHAEYDRTVQRLTFYMHVYLTPDQWCKVGEHCAALLDQRKASYQAFVTHHAGSPWEGKVAHALRQLQKPTASGALATSQAYIDDAYKQAAKQMLAWYTARGDVAAQRLLGTAHNAWLTQHEARTEALCRQLQPADCKTLRGYERDKLAAVFGRMQVLIGRSAAPSP